MMKTTYLLAAGMSCSLLLCTIGCDLGTYSGRYNERIGKMKSMAITNENLASTNTSISGVGKIRLPKNLAGEGSESFGPNDAQNRAQVPGMNFPGFVASHVGYLQFDGSWLPAQMYFYRVSAEGKNELEFQKEVRELIKSKLSNFEGRWTKQTIASYDGTEHPWASLTVLGTQLFFVMDSEGNEKSDSKMGQMELFMTSNDSSHLLVVFRAPADVFDMNMVKGSIAALQEFH